MKKKIVSIISALVLIGSVLGGCGSSGEPDDFATNNVDGVTTTEAAVQEQTQNENAIDAKDIKVGVVYISDPNDGEGYTYTHDLGIIGMQENLGLSADQIIRRIAADDKPDEVKAAVKECIDEGCKIIFTSSFGYMQPASEMAEEYPDVYFAQMAGYLHNSTNYSNYFGRIYQARYLSGIVAGKKTKSNKIGFVAAMGKDNSEVTSGLDAFALGVAAVNPDAQVYVVVTNSWYDPEKEKQAAKRLLDMGCDVMAQHCDTAYPQTLAAEYGAYGIGYNSDMSKETPDSCLCSVMWNWNAYYTAAVSSVIKGNWTGEDYFGGMGEGVVQLSDLASFVEEGTAELVNEATTQILSGSFNVFDGVIETNTGETIGVEGQTLDDDTIKNEIHWYYKNVVIL